MTILIKLIKKETIKKTPGISILIRLFSCKKTFSMSFNWFISVISWKLNKESDRKGAEFIGLACFDRLEKEDKKRLKENLNFYYNNNFLSKFIIINEK